MNIIDNLENDLHSAEKKILLDYNKVIAILHTYFDGDHPAVKEVKKLAGEHKPGESITGSQTSGTQTAAGSIVNNALIPVSPSVTEGLQQATQTPLETILSPESGASSVTGSSNSGISGSNS